MRKSAPRSRQITTPAPHHSVFSCRPTNSMKALKAHPPPKRRRQCRRTCCRRSRCPGGSRCRTNSYAVTRPARRPSESESCRECRCPASDERNGSSYASNVSATGRYRRPYCAKKNFAVFAGSSEVSALYLNSQISCFSDVDYLSA